MGTSHLKNGDPCQDAGVCEVVGGPRGEDVLIAIACDGAGSARLSEVGSGETCRFVLQRIKTLLDGGMPVIEITRDVATRIILDARENLRATAEKAGVAARDLACTLVGGVVSDDAAAFFQVGDGVAIVGPHNEPIDEFSWIFWPERGEYANTTTFLTDEMVAEHLQHTAVPHRIDEVAVLTDGIQNLVLDYKEHSAHSPFFSRMMAPLRSHSDEGSIESLNSALAAFLGSTAINDRTDDDKTLILATRRIVEEG